MKKNLVLRVTGVLSFKLFIVYAVFIRLLFSGAAYAQCGTTINSFPYAEGFESGAAWMMGGTSSSWAWGTPGHVTISSAGSGTKCWCTGGLTGSSYNGSQQSWIESPCFDFTSLNYPWISFKIFWECENIWDGMVLQYTINNGTTWLNVGAFNDPVNCLNANWYNYANISNITQASPRNGWCGRNGATSGSCAGGGGSAGWVTAKHCMSNLANQSSVKFRFLFGSGTTCNSYDGIAVDDILIQDAPANAANFSYACAGINGASFTNLSPQCPTSYVWNFGDPASGSANTSSAQNPSHTFSAPGTYTVSLTASGPCNAPSTTLIPVSILSVSTTVTNLSCFGSADGSSTVTAGGGTPAYSYTWLPVGGNSNVASGLPAGIYTVAVTDVYNCITNHTTAVTQPPAIAAAISQTDVSCFGFADGALSAVASQGVPAYSYTWLPSGANTTGISGLSVGAYSLTVKDSHGCSSQFVTLIKEPPPLVITITSTNVTCFGAANGHASAPAAGGTPGYSYTWSPMPFVLSTISNLAPGAYSVVVKDAHNCVVSGSLAITQPAAPVGGSILSNTPTCGAANGGATVLANGGTTLAPGDYTYNWLPTGGSLKTATGLTGGSYSVTVTDLNNCVATLTVDLALSFPVTISVGVINASCSYLQDGSATANVSGGIAPYTYTWSPAPASGQGNNTITGLAAGNYSVTTADVNNCLVSTTFSVTSPLPLSVTSAITNVSCFGGSDGAFSLIANGGTPAYSFTCSPFGSIGNSINNLIAGNYTVTLKDNHSCITTSVVPVLQPAILSSTLNHTNVLCFGSNTGSTSGLISGGTPGYTYIWAPTGGNASSASGLTAGVYSLVVQDTHNCTLISTVTVSQPAAPLAAGAVVNSVTCYGGHNGSATVTAIGGTPGYSYSWSIGASPLPYALGLTAGGYVVTVTDLNNCITTASLTVMQPAQLFVTATASKFCSGQPGILSAITTATALPLSYTWNSTTSLTNSISVTTTATTLYHVSVTDGNGCVSVPDTALIHIPKPMHLITSPHVRVCEGQNTLLLSDAEGGDGNYSFLWQPGSLAGPTQTLTIREPRVYTVSVTDDCHFVTDTLVSVDYFPVPNSGITFDKSSGCSPLCISFSNDSLLKTGQVQSFSWSFGDTVITNDPAPVHCYTKAGNQQVQLHYVMKNGCAGIRNAPGNIHIDPAPVAAFTTTSMQFDSYSPTANFINQSKGAATYQWYFNNDGRSSDENPSHTFLNVGEQAITLIAENEFGCTHALVKKISIEPEFTFFAPNSFSPNNDEVNDLFTPLGMGWNEDRFELNIYDRWGERIFGTKNSHEGWNGKARGSDGPIANGIYVWKVSMYDMFFRYHEFVGYVSLEK